VRETATTPRRRRIEGFGDEERDVERLAASRLEFEKDRMGGAAEPTPLARFLKGAVGMIARRIGGRVDWRERGESARQ
jgi:hypothetical protein